MNKTISIIFLSLLSTFSHADNSGKNSNTQDKYSIINMRISHNFPLNSNNGKAMFKLKEMLETKLQKKIKIELTEKDPLFEQKNEIEAVEIGAIDLALISTERISNYYNNLDFQIFDIPYLFSSPKDFERFVNSNTATKMLISLNKKENAIQPLAFWPEESKVLLSRTPIKTIKDISKLKFGFNSSELNEKFIKLLKANPISLDNNASYILKSMQGYTQTPVDIIEETTDNILYHKYYETFKNITITNHTYNNYILVANKKWLNSLPANIKDEIINTTNQIVSSNIVLFNENHEKNLKTLEITPNVNVFHLNKEEIDEFKKNSILVHDLFLNQYNKNLLLETYQTLKKR